MLGFAVVQTNRLDITLKLLKAQVKHRLRGIGYRKQLAGGFVHAHVCRLGGQQYSCHQFKHAGVFKLRHRHRVGGFQGGKKWRDIGGFHALQCMAWLAKGGAPSHAVFSCCLLWLAARTLIQLFGTILLALR